MALAHGFVDSGGGGVGDRDVGDGRGETRLLEVAGVWGLGVLAGKKKEKGCGGLTCFINKTGCWIGFGGGLGNGPRGVIRWAGVVVCWIRFCCFGLI